ncbi:MAG: HU family DNA-binding protein [Bacteroides sp.]|nr:HU family DNA-binding protein [Bacteroides sp.]
MAIVFDWYENPNAEGVEEERGLHPRLLLNGKMEMETLCARIHERSSLSVGDVKNTLDNMAQIFGEELREGRSVHIEGVGYFTPVLEATEKVTRNTPRKNVKIALRTVSFRPDARLKGELTGVKATQSKISGFYARPSDEAIDRGLEQYFAGHDVLVRSAFQSLFNVSRTTANRYLQRLLKAGKLLNNGTRRQPIYRAAPGFYGAG